MSSLLQKKLPERHGLSKHPLYRVWVGMRVRCYDPKHCMYHRYGGRGITVCDEWLESFKAFYDFAIAHGWRKGLETDRIDNNGNYEPQNVRFVTTLENHQNKCTVRPITAWGETKGINAWVRDPRCNVGLACFTNRMKQGLSPEAAMTLPQTAARRYQSTEVTLWGETKSLYAWSKDDRISVSIDCIYKRLRRGWRPMDALLTPTRTQKKRPPQPQTTRVTVAMLRAHRARRRRRTRRSTDGQLPLPFAA